LTDAERNGTKARGFTASRSVLMQAPERVE